METAPAQAGAVSQFEVNFVLKLKEKFQGQLDLARIQRALDYAEVGRANVVVGQTVVSVVENVEKFRTELQCFRFRDFEIFQR